MAAYETISGRKLDRQRVDTLTGLHRMYELSQVGYDPYDVAERIRQVKVWESWTRNRG